ncbi:MAG: hypothetical protein HYY24_25745 [Verrucomicrobia bacterium]|nr:hypothetical protein [Verrucomicrobiota bacterium]
MRKLPFVALLLAVLTVPAFSHAAGLTNVFSFTEETKIKGLFTEVNGELYFACEKGGAMNFGYIGKFNPASNTLTALQPFLVETKVKGGLTRYTSNELLFVCEKGGAANFGFVGTFNLVDNSITRLHEFPAETKPKTAPIQLGTNDGWFFYTDKGGTANLGSLARFQPGAGVSVAASFTLDTGIKFDALPLLWSNQVYYAAREGGDTNQLAGKGAGAIGTIDLATGTVTKLVNLNAANHGAKIKSLIPFNGLLHFTADEGGDLTENTGKGWGALGYFNPADNSVTRYFVCDDVTTGRKPRGLVPVGDRLYFNCGEGGPNTFGTFGCVTNGTNVTIVGVNTETIGAKTDAGITRFGRFIYFVTELGTPNFLGGISAYELPDGLEPAQPPALTIARVGNSLQLSWPQSASAFVLERCDALTSASWTIIAGPGVNTATVLLDGSAGLFRLRR